MYRPLRFWTWWTAGLMILSAHADLLHVAVEPSLRTVAQNLAQVWADAQPETDVELSVAPIARLEEGLAKGSEWDVVMAPGEGTLRRWCDEKKLVQDSLKFPVRNNLVLWGRKPVVIDEELDWYEIFEQEWNKVALADPATSSSGAAVQRMLERRKLWEGAKVGARLVPNEIAALDALKAGRVDAAFVWSADARTLILPGFRAYPLEGEDEVKILIGVALVMGTRQAAAARAFIEAMVATAQRPVWIAAGYDAGVAKVTLQLRRPTTKR